MASSKGTDQATGGKKWNAPEKNPFDIEEGKPRAQAPDQYRWDYIRKALQGDLNAQQAGVPRDSMKQAHEFFISQRRKDLLTGHADRDFLDEFHLWLKGLSRFNRVTSPGGKLLTPWGRRPLTFLPDVQAYLDEFVDQRVRYEQELRKLRLRGVDSLNTAWLYYKYLVRRQLLKRSPDDLRMGIVHFLDDFRTFGNMPTQGVMDRERDPDPVWRQALGATAEAQGIAGPMGLYGKAPTDYTGADGGLQGASNPRAVAQNYSQMMEGRTDALYETSEDMAKRAPIGMGIVQYEEGEPGDLSDPIPYVEDYGDDALFGGDDTTGTTGVKKGGKDKDEDQDDDDGGDDGPETPRGAAQRQLDDFLRGSPSIRTPQNTEALIRALLGAGMSPNETEASVRLVRGTVAQDRDLRELGMTPLGSGAAIGDIDVSPPSRRKGGLLPEQLSFGDTPDRQVEPSPDKPQTPDIQSAELAELWAEVDEAVRANAQARKERTKGSPPAPVEPSPVKPQTPDIQSVEVLRGGQKKEKITAAELAEFAAEVDEAVRANAQAKKERVAAQRRRAKGSPGLGSKTLPTPATPPTPPTPATPATPATPDEGSMTELMTGGAGSETGTAQPTGRSLAYTEVDRFLDKEFPGLPKKEQQEITEEAVRRIAGFGEFGVAEARSKHVMATRLGAAVDRTSLEIEGLGQVLAKEKSRSTQKAVRERREFLMHVRRALTIWQQKGDYLTYDYE